MNNFELNKLMSVLSKMDKKDLEKGIEKAQEVLKTKDANTIINNLQKGKD